MRGAAFVRRTRGGTVVTTVLPAGSVTTVVTTVLEARSGVATLATVVPAGLETGSLAAFVRRTGLAGLVGAVLDTGSRVPTLVRGTRLAPVIRAGAVVVTAGRTRGGVVIRACAFGAVGRTVLPRAFGGTVPRC
jgi:phage tail protein X